MLSIGLCAVSDIEWTSDAAANIFKFNSNQINAWNLLELSRCCELAHASQ